uniref:Glycine-rich domain-containing protein n=1 Tax=Mantoniella tinhauana virus 1 TaxID=3111543 RepID=A0AB38ZMA1_9VIRU
MFLSQWLMISRVVAASLVPTIVDYPTPEEFFLAFDGSNTLFMYGGSKSSASNVAIYYDGYQHEMGNAYPVTISEPGEYKARVDICGEKYLTEAVTVSEPVTTTTTGTLAFHHGTFDNVYGDDSVTVAAENGHVYADTPLGTYSWGTLTANTTTSSNTTYEWTPPVSSITADVLMVAGGGGGGELNGGGGGAGGLLFYPGETLSGQKTIVVGNGGAGATADIGSNGNNTTFSGFTDARGGGAGNAASQTGNSGGSGGGGGQNASGGAGFSTQGNDGGAGAASYSGGGGGGANTSGVDATNTKAGDGGEGKDLTSTFGTTYGDGGYFASGGGGGHRNDVEGVSAGIAQQGGGGNGSGNVGNAADAHTGGGGGGGGFNGTTNDTFNGGAGGSGIVLMKYTYDTTVSGVSPVLGPKSTLAFHHGTFDNVYGDLTVSNAAANGHVFADTPLGTYSWGTLTANTTTSSNTTYEWTPSSTMVADVLMVAGGGTGGGADNGAGGGGGGGAGGLRLYTNETLLGQKTIVVGNGGIVNRKNGNNTTFTGLLPVIGGGTGGGGTTLDERPAGDGGSGGGGFRNYSTSSGNGIPGQGNDGGSGSITYTPGIEQGGSGGGGAGGQGFGANGPDGANGGAGVDLRSTFGTTYGDGGYFASGGGGGKHSGNNGTAPLGGGGNGGVTDHGQKHTGGGGGGAALAQYTTDGNGGSGIVLLSYQYSTTQLTYNTYDKLTLANTSNANVESSLRLGSNVWEVGTASNIWICKPGDYKSFTVDPDAQAAYFGNVTVGTVTQELTEGYYDNINTDFSTTNGTLISIGYFTASGSADASYLLVGKTNTQLNVYKGTPTTGYSLYQTLTTTSSYYSTMSYDALYILNNNNTGAIDFYKHTPTQTPKYTITTNKFTRETGTHGKISFVPNSYNFGYTVKNATSYLRLYLYKHISNDTWDSPTIIDLTTLGLSVNITWGIYGISFSDDGKLLSLGSGAGSNDQVVILNVNWNTMSVSLVNTITTPVVYMWTASLSRDGKYLYCAQSSGDSVVMYYSEDKWVTYTNVTSSFTNLRYLGSHTTTFLGEYVIGAHYETPAGADDNIRLFKWGDYVSPQPIQPTLTSTTPGTLAFHYGDFDNVYGDLTVSNAAANGHVYADTPTGTYAWGTLGSVSNTATNTTYTWTPPDGFIATDLLMVAGGGGGGGAHGGGGGAGGLILDTGKIINGQKTIVVGNGGLGGLGYNNGTNSIGINGTNTSFSGLTTVLGGGGGGAEGSGTDGSGNSGGSGGGGGRFTSANGGSGTDDQGNNGGNGGPIPGGGGGGAGTTGFPGTSSGGGNGGAGRDLRSIFGSTYGDNGWFASGGGGAGFSTGYDIGIATSGGGSNGTTGSTKPPDAQKHTGGGGGGAGFSGNSGSRLGATGGSGIVLMNYTIPTPLIPSLTYDGYNKLTVVGDQDQTLYKDSNSWSLGTASSVYVADPGEYTYFTRDAATAFLANVSVSNVTNNVISVGFNNDDQTKIVASDAQAGDQFGYSVAISGDYAIVGARSEDAGGSSAGAAYVFKRTGDNTWSSGTKIVASDAQAGDSFGRSVAISGDYAIVGARREDAGGSDAGAAYVFKRTGDNTWSSGTKIVASDAQAGDEFGHSVAISGDYAIVGALYEDAGGSDAGAAYIFKRTGDNTWSSGTKIVASDAQASDYFGISVAISGDYAIVGAHNEDAGGSDAGAAYVFKRTGDNTWSSGTKIVASDAQAGDFFGFSVAISGDYAIVGAYGEDAGGSDAGASYIFQAQYQTDVPPTTLTYDGITNLKITGAEASSYITYKSATNDKLLACGTDLTTYPLYRAGGNYKAEVSGPTTFTFTSNVTVPEGELLPLYKYPPDGGTTTSLTYGTDADSVAEWTLSGADYGNGGYFAVANVTSVTNKSAYHAFDSNLTAGFENTTATTGTLRIQLPSAETIHKYVVWPKAADGKRPKSWTIEGSQDAVTWTTIHTVTDSPPSLSGDAHEITSPAAYVYYRINVTANNGGTGLEIAELALYGDVAFSITFSDGWVTTNGANTIPIGSTYTLPTYTSSLPVTVTGDTTIDTSVVGANYRVVYTSIGIDELARRVVRRFVVEYPTLAFHYGGFVATDYNSAYSTKEAAAADGFIYADTPSNTYSWGTLTVVSNTTSNTQYTWTPPVASITADVLMVAGGGGGGGGYCAGGGGAGGLILSQGVTLSTVKTITVGNGGSGGIYISAYDHDKGSDGFDTLFSDLSTVKGGGGGGTIGRLTGGQLTPSYYNGNNGGSGGGVGYGNLGVAGTGVVGPPRQGYKGGDTNADDLAGGGGGAGGPGENGSNISSDKRAGDGGLGLDMNSYFNAVYGDNGWFASGGGGGGHSWPPGISSIGGGSSGGLSGSNSSDAKRHTGGGGGGYNTHNIPANNVGGGGASGGSGIVLIKRTA